mmetsp:Transcript_40236/g.70789  ORF Transcript_40236/g.70789 Transcript_40236/m.70789 type:complete len:86 (+) Transcript_40236:62-319(+)
MGTLGREKSCFWNNITNTPICIETSFFQMKILSHSTMRRARLAVLDLSPLFDLCDFEALKNLLDLGFIDFEDFAKIGRSIGELRN